MLDCRYILIVNSHLRQRQQATHRSVAKVRLKNKSCRDNRRSCADINLNLSLRDWDFFNTPFCKAEHRRYKLTPLQAETINMAITKDQKKVMLDKIIDRLKKAKSVVFSEYRGINVKSMTVLRKQLRGQKIDYLIVKKTLLKIGAKEAKLPEIDEKMLTGPIAVAISYEDEIAPIKILYGMSKDKNFEKKLNLTGGIIEGKILSKAEVMMLATIPSKQELLGKLVYLMKSPISRFHFVLHEIVRKFVGTMDALRGKKPADTPKAEFPKAEAPVEAPKVEVVAAPVETATAPVEIAPVVEATPAPTETQQSTN